MEWKYKLRKIRRQIKLYMTLPHVWILLIILALAMLLCMLSVVYINNNLYLSSVFANMFTGLVTGVIICLITTIKSVSLYRTECKIKWLEDLHNECLQFLSMHHKILSHEEKVFKTDVDYNDYVYDVLSFGNGISQKISQGRFKEALPFNTYKYCKKEFYFDAVEIMKENDILREKIIVQDVSKLSKADVRKLFKTMERPIVTLNSDIVKKIEMLKTKRKAINISVG